MTKKIGYSKTYPILNIGVWEKIWIEEEVPEGTDTRQVLYDLKKQVENFHYESNKADEKKAEPKKESIETDEQTEKEISELKAQLEGCITYDRAFDMLQSSPYRYNIELKQIVMAKSKQL